MNKPINRPSHPFDLTGKCALVTGAGRGIGRACAEVLADAGANVIAVARSQEDLESLQRDRPSVEFWATDVNEPAFPTRIEALDRLDILVNNVGTNRPQPFLEVDEESLDLLLGLNVRAAFRTAQAAAKVMVRQGSGSIVHMTSQMGHIGAANRTVYCMSKHAIEGLNKAMAVELAPTGVRVNAVAPTFIETPLTAPMLADPEFQSEVLGKIPMQRVGKVEEVANAVLFLASDAASLVTGDSLKTDGGWTAV